jgi:hypothetical protein
MSIHEWIRRDDQPSTRLARKRRDGGLDLGIVVYWCFRKLDGERCGGRPEFA